MEIALPLDLELELNLCSGRFSHYNPPRYTVKENHTSQFVAVRGTFENIQPLRDGRSDASRMYLQGAVRK